MSEVAGRKLIKVGDLDVVVKELTVAEVRQLLDQESSGDIPDVIGDSLFPDLRLADIPLLTNLTSNQLESLLPSQVQAVIEACRGVNRHFFEMTARLSKVLARP
ncbi:hypothetical protein [Pseudomonas citronellolis]|uniref:hypothetical protein n=1 Tax=Pseudomonas citronellolis TaxID=53408 RepID=UPI0023E3F799|nr:hypothetical protein [Pseudomonas citronellolis]MDF3932150.1 hypothetical protein [Pseudomonas citronellolis]